MPKPPASDLLGYRYTMLEAFEAWHSGSMLSAQRMGELEELLAGFCEAFAKLDQWKRKAERGRLWQPMEPCMRPNGPAVVLSVCPQRIAIRTWFTPPLAAREPIEGVVKHVEAGNLAKISSRKLWDEWRAAMAKCGHNPAHWTATDFKVAMGDE